MKLKYISSLQKSVYFTRILYHQRKVGKRLCNHYRQNNRLYSTCTAADPTLASRVTSLIGNLDKGVVLDMTFGDGNHTCEILDKYPGVRVIALDRDEDSYKKAITLQNQKYENRLMPVLGKISELDSLINQTSEGTPLKDNVDVILIDPGVSDIQLSNVSRGFQYNVEAPLDMCMDKNSEIKVSDVMKHIDENDLHRILKFYGGESQARKISAALIESRYELRAMTTTTHLRQVVHRLFGNSYSTGCIFQGLRMFVNNELNELNYAMTLAHHYLKPQGKLITISHNPQEDGIFTDHISGKDIDVKTDKYGSIKQTRSSLEVFSSEELDESVPKLWQSMTRGPIIPSLEDQNANTALRQVRIRVAKKLMSR